MLNDESNFWKENCKLKRNQLIKLSNGGKEMGIIWILIHLAAFKILRIYLNLTAILEFSSDN